MRVWVFEDNLIWSSRLLQSLRALGHEATVQTSLPTEGAADVAILNLASPQLQALVPALKQRGIRTLGHAGHKEKDLLALGRQSGCDLVATNSELTYKIESLLEKLSAT